jgi:hypothetical protein
MSEVKEVELKPCPLCGGNDIRHEPGQFIACMNINCGCQVDIGSPWGGPKEDGIAFLVTAWNTRPASTGKGEGLRDDLEHTVSLLRFTADQAAGVDTDATEGYASGLQHAAAYLELLLAETALPVSTSQGVGDDHD